MKSKLTTETKVSDAFKLTTPAVIATKRSLISLCADINRDFRVDCNISICEKCSHETYNIIISKVPLLKEMPYELLEEYINFYQNVRNIVAHLYAREKIKISKDLVKYFDSIIKPQYSVEIEDEVTIYGVVYLLTFISKRSHAWSVFTDLFKKENFSGIKPDEGQVMYKYLKDYTMAGTAKYIEGDIKGIDVLHLNALISKNITNIIFEIEKAAFHNKLRSYGLSSNFLDELSRIEKIKNPSEIRLLRNAFFHGYYLFDKFKIPGGQEITITFYFVIKTLADLKKAISNNSVCEYLNNKIEVFGKELLHFFFARMLEVSYKILDKRLLTSDKIDTRVLSTISLFLKIDYYSKKHLPLTCELLPNENITMSLQKKKFTHVCKRETTTNNFRIINFKNENGFKIGQFSTSITNFYLVQVDLPKKYENKINEKQISDIKIKKVKDFCRLISLNSADI